MSTIPASYDVTVNPGVLSAGGNALQTLGLVLDNSGRIPLGSVLSFPNPLAVGSYFGLASAQYAGAQVYFLGFDNSTVKPAALLMAQYPLQDAAAFLRGGSVAGLTIAQLQAITGTLNITIDGYAHNAASLNLSSASSFSAAAALIQTAINGALASAATFTGAIAPATASVTGFIDGDILTVTAVSSGVLVDGAFITGTGVTASTQIESQQGGTPGGIGTYTVSKLQVVASTTISAAYGTLTVSAVATGTLSVGQLIAGGATTANTVIGQLGTGTGLTGTYFVNNTQTVVSGSLTAGPVPAVVSYDVISGGFLITSGIFGTPSTIAFATGSTADPLNLRQTDGAVISQGAFAATPNAYMTTLTNITSNWASFMTIFDPDDGVGNTVKQAFSAWTNSTNGEFIYAAWDTDITPTLSNNASTSLGQILKANNSSGTICIWEPVTAGGVDPLQHAWYILGVGASIDWTRFNGRITYKFKGQTGLVASVTDEQTAANLTANGYNYYGAVATANQGFLYWAEGSISGPFLWADAYIDQLQFDAALQLAGLELLTNTPSVPYNAAGYALIEAGLLDPITAALSFGTIRAGVTLSNAQIAEINNIAGNSTAASIVAQQGWYLQVAPASPQTRQVRKSPTITLWYTDGGSVHKLVIASIDVQ